MNKYNIGLLYRLAEDFNGLTFMSKFAIGKDLGILEDFDAWLEDDDLELKVYQQAIVGGKVPEFARYIYRAKGFGVRDVTGE
jgi:hypothetical protein